MSYVLWTNYFLKEQGYDSDTTLLYQDNKSAILLEKNGQQSSSRRTRHMNIRYSFITDCIKNKKFQVEYCQTDDMIADFLTKPLQGSKFAKFQKLILNHQE